MRGQYLIPAAGGLVACILACAPVHSSPPNNIQPYRQQYDEQYGSQQPTPQPSANHSQQSKPSVIPSAQAAEPQLTVPEMLAVKGKIAEADKYITANLPGVAFLTLLEAQQLSQGAFGNELNQRINFAVQQSKDWLDTYKVNIRVVDRTNSGRGGYIQADLFGKEYTPGIQMVASGGAYILTLEINSVSKVEENISIMRHIVRIPTGTVKTPNGVYTAKRDQLNIKCQDYFARRDAASGSTIDAFAGGAGLFNAVENNNLLDGLIGFAKIVDAGQRQGSSDVSESNCEGAMQDLENTPMYTQDVVTTPTPYDSVTTKKTVIAGIKITFAGPQGVLYTSPPLKVEYYKKDFSQPDIPDAGVRGDEQEQISDRDVYQGLFSKIGEEVYNQFAQGKGLWDVIALKEAQRKTGLLAKEAYVQLYFDGHTSAIQEVARDYIVGHTSLTADQLLLPTR